MKKVFLYQILLFIAAIPSSVKSQTNEVTFPEVNYDFSLMPRTQLSPMGIKLFDDYCTHRPGGGEAPGSNNYGTLLSIYGKVNHWETNLYFGYDKKFYYRTSAWSGGTAEDGTVGGFNEWRQVLDSKSDVESSGNLKITGSGNHYIASGNVGIGTTNPSAKLTVKGDILASKVEIKNDSEIPASDYVFDQGYNLRSLQEVEQFVKTNRHLPEVPSAKEFKENGYSVGEMDDILLRKVEELTLYIIEQQKTIEQLKSKVGQLEKGE